MPLLKQLGATTVEFDKDDDDVVYYDDAFVEDHFLPKHLSYATIYIEGVKVRCN